MTASIAAVLISRLFLVGKKKLFQVWSESLNVTGSLVEDILYRPTGVAVVSRDNRSGIWLAAG